MHRFVGRSTIVAVALATTIGAGAALADTSGISPESLKSALTSTRSANSSFANAVTSSALSNRERYARLEVATTDRSEFAALKSPTLGRDQVGILAPEHNGDIQFALAEKSANVAFGDTQSECESTPVKLADVGTALRSLSSEPSSAGEGSSFAQRLQLSASPEIMMNHGKFAAIGSLQGSPSVATIREALIAEGTSNTSFASREVSEIAGIKAALNGSSDASSALSNGTSASQLSSALRKR